MGLVLTQHPAGMCVPADHEVTMPTPDRVRRHDQLQLPQPDLREPVQERGQEHPVGARQPRRVDLPLQDGELMAQRQHLDVWGSKTRVGAVAWGFLDLDHAACW